MQDLGGLVFGKESSTVENGVLGESLYLVFRKQGNQVAKGLRGEGHARSRRFGLCETKGSEGRLVHACFSLSDGAGALLTNGCVYFLIYYLPSVYLNVEECLIFSC